MKIHNDKLTEHFKQIQTVCIQEGKLIPFLFDRPYSEELFLEPKDVEKVRNGISKKELERLDKERADTYKQRRLDIIKISHQRHEDYKTLEEYAINEALTFIKDHPQFNDIVEDATNTGEIEIIE